jgi:threonine synthase
MGAIELVYEKNKLLIDPHTADAYVACQKLIADDWLGGLLIILETAQACKFDQFVYDATGVEATRPVLLRNIEDLPQQVAVIHPDVDEVKRLIRETYEDKNTSS